MDTGSQVLLETQSLSIGYGSQPLIADLNLKLRKASLTGLAGANGTGKSTLMRTLAGLQPHAGGQVLVKGKPLEQCSRNERASLISLVLTERIADEFMTVEELVGMGRAPFTGWHGQLGESDRQMVQKALQLTGTADWAQRTLHTLSDGQAQKVMIARALAQDTPLMLLDEPTAHLDVANRIALLQLLRYLARSEQKSILITSHELEALLQVADTLWLLHPDGTYSEGMPEELALNGFINRAFDTARVYFNIATGAFSFHNGHLEPKLRLGGNAEGVYWTGLALQKAGIGFSTSENRQELPLLSVEMRHTGQWQWYLGKHCSNQLSEVLLWLV